MARPRKLNADWFPHDVNERNKPMVKAIRRKFSHLGYAVWTYLQETLTSSDLFRIKWDDVTVELLAADYDVEPEDLIAIVEYAVKNRAGGSFRRRKQAETGFFVNYRRISFF